MQRLTVPQIAGCLLATLGAVLAGHWAVGLELVDRLVPGASQAGIVPPLLFIGIACCFFDASLRSSPTWLRRSASVFMIALAVVPAAYLFEHATGVSLGVDLPPAGTVPTPANPYPGRLSPNGCVAYAACALAFWQLRYPWSRAREFVFLGSVLAIAVIGLGGLVGYLVGLERLYRFASFNRLLPATAFGFTVASAGLWTFLETFGPRDRKALARVEQRIRRRSLAVLTLVAMGGGVAGFALLRDTFETSVSQNMLLTASTSATSLSNALEASLWFPKIVATRPTVRRTVAQLISDPGDADARSQLQNIAESFYSANMSGAGFFQADGRPILTTGVVNGAARVVHPLQGSGAGAWLLWDGGYLLRAANPIMEGDQLLGRIVTEQRLPLFDKLLGELRASSDSLDAAICSREGDHAVCAPGKFRAEPFQLPLDSPKGTAAAALVRGLAGGRGVEFARDPRGISVVAAYLPVGDYGLALGVKSDVDALYSPLRSRLQLLALALAGIVGFGVMAQRSQVRPVVQQLVASENQLKAILDEQNELVSLSRPDGTLTYVNPAYARYFGRTVESMVGTSLYDHVPDADKASAARRLQSVLASGREASGENRVRAGDASEAWIAWSNTLQRDPKGEPLLRSVGRDVTERKRAELALAASERFIRQITDNLTVRIAYLDPQCRYRFVNQAHCTRFGLTREQIIGRTRSEVSDTSNDALVGPRIAAVLNGEPQHFEIDEMIHGRLRRIEHQLLPDIDADGRVVGFYATGIDITERVANERALRDLTEIFDNTPDFVVQTDPVGNLTFVNPALRRRLRLDTPERRELRTFAQLATPETGARLEDEILPAVGLAGVWTGETTLLDADGQALHVSQLVIAHGDGDGHVARYSAVMRDISLDVANREQLMLQSATLRSVTEAIPAVVAVVGADRRYRFVNNAFERWTGRPRNEIVGRPIEDVVGHDDAARCEPWVARVLAGETVHFERDYPERTHARHLSVTYIPMWSGGMVDGYVGVAQDITEHREEAGRLLNLSQHDPLTGLLNRSGFEDFMRRQADGTGADALGLLYIDLDHFKPVNDQHGHAVGDELLRLFAQRVQGLVRPSDAVARLGGDEFAVAMTGVRELAHAEFVADKIVDAAKLPFVIGVLEVGVGASVGVAFRVEAASGWQGLVERADTNLYRAKAAGRGQRA
jgi:diguanylate cyclase (GGDEF)-like protein/PAS domain S-box-containing protein